MTSEIDREYIYLQRKIFEKTLYFVMKQEPEKALEFFEKAQKIVDEELNNDK